MNQFSKILIIRLSSIGDIVHTLPVLPTLRERFPQAKIGWLIENSFGSLLQNIEQLDQIYRVNTFKWRKKPLSKSTWRQISRNLSQLRKENFDLALDFQGLVKSAFMGWLSGAKLRIGFEAKALREPLSRIFYHKVNSTTLKEPHIIHKNLSLLNSLGIKGDKIDFPPFLGKSDRDFASLCIKKLKLNSFAIINPGAGWSCKQWEIEKYAALADILKSRYKLNVLLSWGPGEKKLATRLRSLMKHPAVVLSPTSILQLAALIERASLFIGSDSGPLHLAIALKRPAIGLFGPTDPKRNGSLNPQDIIISKDLDCSPCYQRNCPEPLCMQSISVDEVAEAVDKRLKAIDIKTKA